MFGQRHQFRWCDRIADQDFADARGEFSFLRARLAHESCLHARDYMVDIFLAAAQVGIVHRLEHGDEAITLHLQCGAGAIAADADQVVNPGGQFAVGQHQAVRVDELGDFACHRSVQFLP